jgi:hypothetical protein
VTDAPISSKQRLDHLRRYQFAPENGRREGDLVMIDDAAGHWVMYSDAVREVERALADRDPVGTKLEGELREYARQLVSFQEENKRQAAEIERLTAHETTRDDQLVADTIAQNTRLLSALTKVTESWVNGRRVLDGIPLSVANEARQALELRLAVEPTSVQCTCGPESGGEHEPNCPKRLHLLRHVKAKCGHDVARLLDLGHTHCPNCRSPLQHSGEQT